MKILLVASEVAPYAKTGGLADVAGALPIALAKLGHDVRVAMPGYGTINFSDEKPNPIQTDMSVELGTLAYTASVSESHLPGTNVPIYFISNSELFDRPGLYQEDGKDYPDNARRFAFFCKAVVWMIKGLNWLPDVIHCNDWQTALLPVMLCTDVNMMHDASLQKIRTVYTIHNLAYQGLFSSETLTDIGLSWDVFHPDGMEFFGSLNFMKGGLTYADVLTTVSPTYALEIQTPEFGCGLEGLLAKRSVDLHGILNGIDYEQWNPETDEFTPAHFGADYMAGKAQCKADLQKELGLDQAAQVPLLVMISRLDPQKGLDILLPLFGNLLKRNVQIAVLGTGFSEYHQALEDYANANSAKMAARLKFDNGLAHRMEAAADMFLMPSRYEPCGLNQLFSLRYGTVPVVRKTGGLADSVEQASQDGSTGTGFVFEEYSSLALLHTINEALECYGNSTVWHQIQQRGMRRDFSWDISARSYAELYR